MATRRQFLAGIGAGALAVGFSSGAGTWVSAADAAGSAGFDHVPHLDGTLYLDDATRAADSRDLGRMVFHTPQAVLRPGSVRDIQAMIRFCALRRIKVSMRGQGHSTYGQGLTTGLLIDSSTLNTIHSIGPAGADVDAGVLWRDIVRAGQPLGLTVPLTTTYVGLSVGGTLSMGGFGARNDTGVQIDTVRELHVVTGTGELVRCSPERDRALFEVALGGLGQCGIIVRARIETVPAKARARVYQLGYLDGSQFFGDFRLLTDRGEFDGVYNLFSLQGNVIPYQLNAVVFYDPADPPDDASLLRGLSRPPSAATVTDTSYVGWVERYDPVIAFWRATAHWDDLIKPWYDVILPESQVEPYVTSTVAGLTPADIGATGVGFVFRVRRSDLTRPFFRIPEPDCGDWVYLFDILTSSNAPGPDPAFTAAMSERNQRWFDQARALGATRYPIGSLDFGRADWAAQYGEMWPELVRRKRWFDPVNILTPGPGIF